MTAPRGVRLFLTLWPAVLAAQQGLVLHDGTPVRLRLNRDLISAAAEAGDSADFEVLDAVKVDGALVIAPGATAIATITEAQSKGGMTSGGQLDVNIDYVRLVNGATVALRAVKEADGGGHTNAAAGAMAATSLVWGPSAPFFPYLHGNDIVVPEGSEITAYVQGEVILDPTRFGLPPVFAPLPVPSVATPSSGPQVSDADPPVPPAAAAAPTQPALRPMTNRDVIELKVAGLSDEFVIAKIQRSPADYQLDTDDIIALRKSDVSEPVIQAMMAALLPLEQPVPPAAVIAVPQPQSAAESTQTATQITVTDPPPQADPANGGSADKPKVSLLTKLKRVWSDDAERRNSTLPLSARPQPPPPPEFALTSVMVLSKPSGARIFVDGYPAGMTPGLVKLVPGNYKLTLQAEGYPPYTQQITVEPGQVSSVGVALDTGK